jgi:hypothetical protein
MYQLCIFPHPSSSKDCINSEGPLLLSVVLLIKLVVSYVMFIQGIVRGEGGHHSEKHD